MSPTIFWFVIEYCKSLTLKPPVAAKPEEFADPLVPWKIPIELVLYLFIFIVPPLAGKPDCTLRLTATFEGPAVFVKYEVTPPITALKPKVKFLTAASLL